MRRVACILLAALLLFAGCTVPSQNLMPTANMNGTVENIFTISQTTPNDATAPTDATTNAPTEPGTVIMGSISFGPEGKPEKNEFGVYRIYDGGQMHLPFSVISTGTVATYDVGILLFVDGVAQPYQVGPDGEYAYMHTFSQKDGTQMLGTTTTIADIYFTPITGKEGDMLELYALCMLNPNYVPSQGMFGFANTFGAVSSQTRLKYNDTPSEDTYPEKSTRLLDVSTSMIDCTAMDVVDWTDEDMITKQRTTFTANGESPYVYGVTKDTQITLHFAVWGSPYVHYGLIFFVDNNPVYTADLSDIWVTVEMGQKTVIEATLDMTGFSGESAVYAMLVPRNYYTSEIETVAEFYGKTIYLLEKDA